MKHESFKEFFDDCRWPSYMPSVAAYSAMMTGHGLVDVQVWGEDADRHFPDEAALVGWLDQPSLVPFLAALPGRSRSGVPTDSREPHDREDPMR